MMKWGCWHPYGYGLSRVNNNCHKIVMANIAQLVNNLHSLILAKGEYCIATPTYDVFQMFKDYQGADAVRAVSLIRIRMGKRIIWMTWLFLPHVGMVMLP